jgi:hypothetical protein
VVGGWWLVVRQGYKMKNFKKQIVHHGNVQPRRDPGKPIRVTFALYSLQTPLGKNPRPPITNI